VLDNILATPGSCTQPNAPEDWFLPTIGVAGMISERYENVCVEHEYLAEAATVEGLD